MNKIVVLLVLIIVIIYQVDYNQVKNGYEPIFTIKIEKENKINYYGAFYKVERFIAKHINESMYEDNKIKIGLWLYTWEVKLKEKELQHEFEIKTSIENNCNNMEYLYYIEENKSKIYTICLNKIEIRFKDETIDFYDALEQRKISMEKIKQQMTEINSFNHKTYIDNSNISNQGLKILECKNKNYYIVPEKQEYNESLCQ